MFAPTCSTAQKTDKKHVVGANSVRPWVFGQCAAMARRWMQRKVGGRTMFAPTCSTAQKTDKNHVVGAHSVRPRAFGQCAVMARRWMQRKRLAGERCSPADVWSVRSHGPKADAAQGWRANDVRPYMLYIIKQPVLYCAVFIITIITIHSIHSIRSIRSIHFIGMQIWIERIKWIIRIKRIVNLY